MNIYRNISNNYLFFLRLLFETFISVFNSHIHRVNDNIATVFYI